MRKSASEIIRNLEMRIARLENKTAKLSWDVLYNVIEALVDQIADTTRNPSLSRPTPEKARFVSWFMTEGKEGEIPEGITSRIIDDSLKTVLLSPPSWMSHLLPSDPKKRLQLARQIKTPKIARQAAKLDFDFVHLSKCIDVVEQWSYSLDSIKTIIANLQSRYRVGNRLLKDAWAEHGGLMDDMAMDGASRKEIDCGDDLGEFLYQVEKKKVNNINKSARHKRIDSRQLKWVKNQMRSSNLKDQMKSWERSQGRVKFVEWVELKDDSSDELELYGKYDTGSEIVYVSFQRDLDDEDSYAWQWTHTVNSEDWDKGFYH